MHNLDGVKEVILAYFTKLYQFEQSYWPFEHPWSFDWRASLNEEEANSLVQIPSNEEIWCALKSMKPYKAPGVDGLHARFFQRFWLLVGESMKKIVRDIFENHEVPAFLNQTLIILIPKQLGPKPWDISDPSVYAIRYIKLFQKFWCKDLDPACPSLYRLCKPLSLRGEEV